MSNVMINTITIENYRSIRHLTLDLPPDELRLLARDPVSGETVDITPPILEIERRLELFDGALGELWFSGGLE